MAHPFDVVWIHGSANCATNSDPPIQIHRFDEDTFILRQNKCIEPETSFEGPFMYLLFGEDRAILLDTGATPSAQRFPIGKTVRGLILDRARERGRESIPLLICHSHAHSDHAQGDAQFTGSGVRIVPPTFSAVKQFFGFTNWPEQQSKVELGNRTLDVIPSPGHEEAHLAFYDRRAKLLLSGDTLYPGLLVVRDWTAYKRSVARLKRFADENEIRFVLGAHIEMRSARGKWFGLGRTFQPNEHVLQLEARHLVELNDALSKLPLPRVDRHDDFIIQPVNLPFPPPDE
jgi:hydroxyacylglutathione hydrolase